MLRAGEESAILAPGRWIRRLYDWVLGWANSRYGGWALFAIAAAEASFFPIPPDVLLIALCIGRPSRSLHFALICTAGSVVGGMVGYLIGFQLFEHLGRPILEVYGAMEAFDEVGRRYRENLVIALGAAGFTPIPYKVFTIAAGAFTVPFGPFVTISLASRAARFFIVAGLIRIWGPEIRSFIDRYFNLLTIVFTVLLVMGFIIVKYLL